MEIRYFAQVVAVFSPARLITLFESFDRFAQLHDDETLFYPAMSIPLSNLNFAQFIEPNNLAIAQAIARMTVSYASKIRQPCRPR